MPEQLSPFLPGGLTTLGADGMGRSDSREALRRHFEIDAESIVVATLYRLSELGKLPSKEVAAAIKELDINPDKVDPLYA